MCIHYSFSHHGLCTLHIALCTLHYYTHSMGTWCVGFAYQPCFDFLSTPSQHSLLHHASKDGNDKVLRTKTCTNKKSQQSSSEFKCLPGYIRDLQVEYSCFQFRPSINFGHTNLPRTIWVGLPREIGAVYLVLSPASKPKLFDVCVVMSKHCS